MKLKDYQSKEQQVPKPCPSGFCAKSFFMLCLGSKGSGKTNTIVNIVRDYQKHKFFDKLYIISPTIHDDSKYKQLEEVADEVSLYDDYTNDNFKEIVDDIENDLAEYKKYLRLKELLKRFHNSKKEPEGIFEDEEFLELYYNDFELPKVKYTRPPYSMIIIDDCAGNKDLLKQRGGLFSHFILKSRHKYTSCILGLQLWKNGLPRGLRNNLDWLVLAQNKSLKIKEDVYEDFSSYKTKKEFIDMWDNATAEPYDWFCVNMMLGRDKMFSKNFDEPIPIKKEIVNIIEDAKAKTDTSSQKQEI